jgi:hypothetical protein
LDSGTVAAGGGVTLVAPPVTVLRDGQPFAVAPSSGTVDVPSDCPPCADADISINSAPFATVASGDLLDIPVVNGGANPVGSEQGGGWVIGNNATFINGVQVTDQEAEVNANIAVELDGTPSGVWNAGTQTWEVTAPPPSSGWVRPAEWIPIPDLTAADEQIYAVVAVFENGFNDLSVRGVAGQATIDWGDGSPTVAVTGTNVKKQYDYATVTGAVNQYYDGRNYKQVLFRIYRTGTAITDIRLRLAVSPAARSISNFLDMNVSLPSCTIFDPSGFSISGSKAALICERLRIWSLNSGVLLAGFSNLRVLQLPATKAGTYANMAGAFGNVPQCPIDDFGNIDWQGVTITGAFFNTLTRKHGTMTSTATSLDSYASTSRMLQMMGAITAPNATSAVNMFNECNTLSGTVTVNAPLLQNLNGFAFRCFLLDSLIFTDCAAVTNTSSMVTDCHSLTVLVMPNLTRGVNLGGASGTSMGNYGMNMFANSLGTAVGTQNITVTGTPFGVLLAAADATAVAIAAVITGKGFGIIN